MRHWRFSFYLTACIYLFPVVSFASEPTALFPKIKFYAAMASAAYLPEQEAKVIIEAQGYQLNQYMAPPMSKMHWWMCR